MPIRAYDLRRVGSQRGLREGARLNHTRCRRCVVCEKGCAYFAISLKSARISRPSSIARSAVAIDLARSPDSKYTAKERCNRGKCQPIAILQLSERAYARPPSPQTRCGELKQARTSEREREEG